MSLSVIDNPANFYTIYSDAYNVNEIPNIVTNNVTAYKDNSGNATTLTLGASGNLLIETVQDIRSYMGVSNAYRLYTASYDANTSTRTNKEILNVTQGAFDNTLFSAPSNITISPVNSANSTITLGNLIFSESGNQQVLSTNLNNFLLQEGLAVAGDVSIANNVYVTGNIFGANVNVWSDRINKAYNRIGFGFRINSNDQLELVKYAKFANKDVLKRIAVFGHGNLGSNDNTDLNENYLVFDSLGQVSVTSSGGGLNPIAGGGAAVSGGSNGTASSGSNMTLTGNTSLSGSIVPATSDATIGTQSALMYSVNTSNLVLDDSVLSSSNIYITSTSNAPFVGVGTTAPEYKLHVVGTFYATDDVLTRSDQRFKENITPITSALEKVKAIGGYYYNRVGQSDRCVGVIAQEMQQVLPEVVSVDSQGYMSVAYGNVVGLLIEAVKELESKVNALIG
jgi:hypothetical protein